MQFAAYGQFVLVFYVGEKYSLYNVINFFIHPSSISLDIIPRGSSFYSFNNPYIWFSAAMNGIHKATCNIHARHLLSFYSVSVALQMLESRLCQYSLWVESHLKNINYFQSGKCFFLIINIERRGWILWSCYCRADLEGPMPMLPPSRPGGSLLMLPPSRPGGSYAYAVIVALLSLFLLVLISNLEISVFRL